ncbi:MAG: prolyl oligopeptidase family serine peptidase [Bacteroidales bacterium]|jgi:oligopeptidase B|nr:prolyl oligopeptidase family serine peptidase [Bacteroidales bacterium]
MHSLNKTVVSQSYLLVLLGIISLVSCRHAMPDPPIAKEVRYTDTLSGKIRQDPYHWMENYNDTAVVNYILAENKYTDEYMSGISGLQQLICKELTERNGDSEVTKEQLNDPNSCLSPDGKFRVYVKNGREVRVHQIGKSVSDDPVIYTETRSGFTISIAFSASKKFLFIRSQSQNMTETRFLQAGFLNLKPVLIQTGENGLYYLADHYGDDYFWILTNKKAPNGKLVQAKISHPGADFWIPAVVYHDSTILKGFSVMNKKYLLLLEQKSLKASARIVDLTAIYDPTKGQKIGFNDPEGELVFAGFEAETGKVLLRYSSVVTPSTLYTYDLKANKLGIRWQVKINGYKKENYGTSIARVKTRDGSFIPVTLIFHKDFEKRDGTNPLLLTTPDCPDFAGHPKFNSSWINLLDRGFYIAIAHVDGENENGHSRNDESGLLPVNNAYGDFLDCASFLISQKYTSKGLITGLGRASGSNTVATAINSHPDLFKAVILDKTLVDPLLNLKNSSLSFSFPDNFKKQPYPSMFLIAGDPDQNRNAIGLIKMTALFRKYKTDKNVLILRTGNTISTKEENVCEDRYRSFSEQLAFIFSCYGLEK